MTRDDADATRSADRTRSRCLRLLQRL